LFALLGSGWNALLGNLCFRIERNSAEDLVQQSIDESVDRVNIEPLRSLLDLVQQNRRLDAVVLQQLHGATGITAAKAVLKHLNTLNAKHESKSKHSTPYVGLDDCELDDGFAAALS
jgi:hypothetical protein